MKYSFRPKMTVLSVMRLWPPDTEEKYTASIRVRHEVCFFGWVEEYLCGEEELPKMWAWTRADGRPVTRLAMLEFLDAAMIKFLEENK